MTPDYTYGHTVTKSVNDYLTKKAAGRRSPIRYRRSARRISAST